MWMLPLWIISSILLTICGLIGLHLLIENKRLKKSNQILREIQYTDSVDVSGVIAKFRKLRNLSNRDYVVIAYHDNRIFVGSVDKLNSDPFPWRTVTWNFEYRDMEHALEDLDSRIGTELKRLEGT